MNRRRPDNNGFMECEGCASKPGSPNLCPSCLNNSDTIDRLWAQIKQLLHEEEGYGYYEEKLAVGGTEIDYMVYVNTCGGANGAKWGPFVQYKNAEDCVLRLTARLDVLTAEIKPAPRYWTKEEKNLAGGGK